MTIWSAAPVRVWWMGWSNWRNCCTRICSNNDHRGGETPPLPIMIRPYLITLLALVLALILSLAVGSVFLSPAQIWDVLMGHGTQVSNAILRDIRLPRTALMALTGMA